MTDVDEMQEWWTRKINDCLDFTAPWKTRKVKIKRHSLPKEILHEIQKKKKISKRYQSMVKNGENDPVLTNEFRKQRNYCNKLIKSTVRERNGQNITSESTPKDIWNGINDILKPETTSKSKLRIETENQSIEDPL